MGQQIFDQYSLLHGAVGVIAFFWNVNFLLGLALHALFEYIENTPFGMNIINKYFVGDVSFTWPGAKVEADSVANIWGDNISYIVGYLLAHLLDILGKNRKWH